MIGEKAKVKNFDISQFVADNSWLSTFEAIEKAYSAGVSEQEAVLDKIRAEISDRLGLLDCKKDILAIIDKYKAESEIQE